METVTHDGRVTAYERMDRGTDGAAVVCVHGSGATRGVWKSQLGRLSRERPVVALDLSGHGDSEDVETEPGPETLRAYADDVLAVARAEDARVLCGNSLGGAVVQTILLDHEFDADAAVLAGSGAKLAVLADLREWLADDYERAIEFLHSDDRLLHDPDDRYVEYSKQAMRDVGRAVTERDYLSCHTFDVRDRLGEIAAPVLALTGEHDRLTPPAYHEYLAEHVRDGEWSTIDDAAHLAMLERPEAFNREVNEFLATVDGDSGR
jgi:pimeloyl-ACP methyl ester carboxylesterase